MMSAIDEVSALIPELALWNDGRGISVSDWLYTEPKLDLPVAYATLFWPRFVAIGPYVLREDFDSKNLSLWEQAEKRRSGIEATMNVIYPYELLVPVGGEWSKVAERQAIYLGGVLADIHRVKLARDFPDKRFVVEFWDGTQPEGDDISLSFWQEP